MRKDIRPVLQVSSLGHGMYAFVNGEFVGYAHGTNIDKSFSTQKKCNLKVGVNNITLLSMTVGLPVSDRSIKLDILMNLIF